MTINDYFGSGGCLNRLRPNNYAPRQEQTEMAKAIHECITKGNTLRGEMCALLPIQGDTGSGKSLAALIPMLHQVALHRKAGEAVRGAYATFTTQLRRQLRDKDLELAIRAVALQTGIVLTVGEYWGARQYVSPSALETALKDLPGNDNETRKRLEDVLHWLETDGIDSGLMVDAKEALDIPEHEPLVNGRLDSAWECTWREAKTLAPYQVMRETVRNADILLLSHAAALMNAHRWFNLLTATSEEDEEGDAPNAIRYMVFDEAHRLPDAAANLTDRTLSLTRLVSDLEAALQNNVGQVDAALVKKAVACRDFLQSLGGNGDPNQRHEDVVLMNQPLPTGDGTTVREALRKVKLAAIYKQITDSIKGVRLKSLRGEAREAFLDLRETRDLLDDYLSVLDAGEGGRNNPYQLVNGLSWSPVRRFPSLVMTTLSPGRMVARYWRHYPGQASPDKARESALWSAVILSATLPDLAEIGIFNPKEEEEIKLAWQKSPHLMIPNVQSYPRFEPSEFGRMDFVLSAPVAPATMGDDPQDNGRWTNPEWEEDHLKPMIAAMMAEAKEKDGVLILAPSTLEVALIADFGKTCAWGHRIIAQRQGDKLAALADKFRSTRGGVLISAGGWEGLDLPGQVRHLMITRLPWAPLNQTWMEILRQKYDEKKVKAIMSCRMSRHMEAKLHQGIGRGIRSVDDRTTLWVADSRFGIPSGISVLRDSRVGQSGNRFRMTASVLSTVSKRFHTELNRARIFTATQGVFTPAAPKELGKPRSLGNGALKFLKNKPSDASKEADHGKRA